MQPLTCPVPSNINPLQSNGFLFSITKLPEITFFCQEATLPGIDLPLAVQPTPLINVSQPGDKVTFGNLNITFLIDENMENYKAVSDWMLALGFPKSYRQFTQWVSAHRVFPSDKDGAATVSDGTLQILNSSNNAVRTVTFTDMFPTSLSSIQLQSTSTDTTYLAGQASFVFTLYEMS